MKKVIVIRGPLGVGKSTVARFLAERLDLEYVSLDKIIDDNNLAGEDGIPVESFLKSNEIILDTVKHSDKAVIIDGCFYYPEQIEDLKKRFENIVFFSLFSPVEKCIERDSKREKIYGEDSARFVHMITSKIKVGYEIDNSEQSLEETIESILEKLNLE